MIGETILHYRILSKLGAGGMGEVYLAKDTKLNRLVALKILPAEVARDPERVRRFNAEAKAASALNHPNILIVHDAGQEGDLHFIVAEYIGGENLQERLARGPLPPGEALRIAEKVANALVAAHRAGITHLDLKPSNLMLGKDGLVKVVDWGVAKVTADKPAATGSEGETVKMPAPGVLMATPDYVSPEQLKGEEGDARSDVYGLGVCLHEMLSGQPPFRRQTFGQTIDAVLNDEPTPLGEGVPERVRDVVLAALRKNPEARYQTAREFRRHLRAARRAIRFRRGDPRAIASGLINCAVRRPGLVPASRRPMTRRGLLAVVASLVLALGSGSALAYRAIQPGRLVAQGREFLKLRKGDNLDKALKKCERALWINPRYVPAHVCLADTYALMEEYKGVPSRETLPRAEYHALTAVEINPKAAEAFASLGYIYTKMWRWDEAELAFKRSIELKSDYPRARHWYGMLLRIRRQHNRELAQIKYGLDLDQNDRMLAVNLIIANLMIGQNAKAIEEGDRLRSLDSKFWGARPWVAWARLGLGPGSRSDALSDMEAGVEHSEGSHTLKANLGHVLALTGDTQGAEQILRELEEQYRQGKGIGQNMAKVCAGLGRLDEAFYWLEKDYEARSGDLPHVSWHPAFEPLRRDPRYKDLLRRLNLPVKPDWREGDDRSLDDDKELADSPKCGSGGGLPLIKEANP